MPLIEEFSTVAGMFMAVTDHFKDSDRGAFQRKVDGRYVSITHAELYGQVEAMALALRALGLSRGDRIGIMSENRLEWVVADFACVCSGMVDVPIFPILTAKQVEFIFTDAEVKAVFCSNAFQLNKLLKALPSLPSLNHVVVMQEEVLHGEIDAGGKNLVAFAELLREGMRLREAVGGQLRNLVAQAQPDDLLTLIYTSGTTGNPKGVMLTHGNFAANIHGAAAAFPIHTDDVVLSYLPLCHSYERTAGYYTCFACGATIAFADSIETVSENLLEIRPTLMTSVPRLFERIKGRIEKSVAAGPENNRKIFDWALRIGIEKARAEQREKSVGLLLRARYAFADKLVFTKVRQRTGGRIRFFVSGGAALSTDVGEFFFALGLKVIEGYGMTEASPIISANPFSRPRLGTVGVPLNNVEVRIAEDGEILTRGPHVMKGYLNDPASTAEVIDSDGWLHTGDVGRFDDDGYLRITDRKKYLFVSSGGKNIAPGPIESLLLGSRLIDQIILIGNDRPFITALIVPNFEALVEIAQAQGLNVGALDQHNEREALLDQDAVILVFEAEIKRMQRDLAAFERVRRFGLLPEHFSVENGMLTPTLKVRRNVVEQKFADRIEKMYEGVEMD